MVRFVDSTRSRPHPLLVALGQDPQCLQFRCRSRVNTCASVHWSGMSGCLANPDPETFLQRVPSLLDLAHSAEKPRDQRKAGRSGRLATQSLRTCYEPSTTVEVSSAEVTIILPPWRRASFCSVYNSGETSQLRLCFCESMRDEAWERWLHRCSCKREKQVQLLREIIILVEKVPCQVHLTRKARRELL